MRSSSRGLALKISMLRPNHVRTPDTIQYTDRRQIDTSARTANALVMVRASVGSCENGDSPAKLSMLRTPNQMPTSGRWSVL